LERWTRSGRWTELTGLKTLSLISEHLRIRHGKHLGKHLRLCLISDHIRLSLLLLLCE
jgi:hypothetical protein